MYKKILPAHQMQSWTVLTNLLTHFLSFGLEQPTMINVIREPLDWFSSHYHFKDWFFNYELTLVEILFLDFGNPSTHL